MNQRILYLATCALVVAVLPGCRSGRHKVDLDYRDGTWTVESVHCPEYKRLKMTFSVSDDPDTWDRSVRLSIPSPPTTVAGNPPGGDAPFLLRSPPYETGPSAAKVEIIFPRDDDPDVAEVFVELFWLRPERDITSDNQYIQRTRMAVYQKTHVDDFILEIMTRERQGERRERFDTAVSPIQVIVHTDTEIDRLSIHNPKILKDFVSEAWNHGTDPSQQAPGNTLVQ